MRNNWGTRYLMCPPDHFTVSYTINPWMTPTEQVDQPLAQKQWSELAGAIDDAGGSIEVIDQHPDLPDMVFTANLGVVYDGVFVPAHMRHRQRQKEPDLARHWMSGRGLEVKRLSADTGPCEGMGDALPFGDALVAGYGPRSSAAAWDDVSTVLGTTIIPLELKDERFYHIDLVFSPLDERRALIAPIGLTQEGVRTLTQLVPQPIILTDEEAEAFCANSIVVRDTVIMPSCTERLQSILERSGFAVVVVGVSEFLKAGGAVRCLTLPLDVGSDA